MATTLKTVGEYEGLSGSQISLSKLAQVCPSPPANPGRLSSWAGHEHVIVSSINIDFYLQTSSPPVNIQGITVDICNNIVDNIGIDVIMNETNEPYYIGGVSVDETDLLENYPYIGIGNSGIFTALDSGDAILTLYGFLCRSQNITVWTDIKGRYSNTELHPFEAYTENRFEFNTSTLKQYIKENNTDTIEILMNFVP